jgi:FdhD protein
VELEGLVPTVYQQLSGEEWSTVDSGVPEEASLSIFVNGFELATFMCTPLQQKALALGFLANEGLIAGLDEVRVVHLCAAGTCVDIWLSHAVQHPSRLIITSGCGGGVTFEDLTREFEPLRSDRCVAPEQLQSLMRQLQGASVRYQMVRGIHTSALSDGERLLLVAEDIGRHNTLDKLRGLALLQGIDPRDGILLSSGRISSEMLIKAANMRVPIVVSRTSPTSMSVALAEALGITLVGYARQTRMNVYAGVERLRAAPVMKTGERR